jgi:hypothetical protein
MMERQKSSRRDFGVDLPGLRVTQSPSLTSESRRILAETLDIFRDQANKTQWRPQGLTSIPQVVTAQFHHGNSISALNRPAVHLACDSFCAPQRAGSDRGQAAGSPLDGYSPAGQGGDVPLQAPDFSRRAKAPNTQSEGG